MRAKADVTIRNQNGEAFQGRPVTVYYPDGSLVEAPAYDSEVAGTPVTQPLTTKQGKLYTRDGVSQVYLGTGRYEAEFRRGGEMVREEFNAIDPRDMGGRVIKRARRTANLTTSSTATSPPAAFNEGTLSVSDVEIAADEEVEIALSGARFYNSGANISIIYIVRVLAGVVTILGSTDMQGTSRVSPKRSVFDEPGAGTYTYELRGAVAAGTMTVSATVDNPLELVVRAS